MRGTADGRVGIRHLSITLGDQKVWYRDLPDIEERIRELNIPDEEELWNWGYCRAPREIRRACHERLHGAHRLSRRGEH